MMQSSSRTCLDKTSPSMKASTHKSQASNIVNELNLNKNISSPAAITHEKIIINAKKPDDAKISTQNIYKSGQSPIKHLGKVFFC